MVLITAMSAGSQRALDYVTAWGMTFTLAWEMAMTLGLARPMNINEHGVNYIHRQYTFEVKLTGLADQRWRYCGKYRQTSLANFSILSVDHHVAVQMTSNGRSSISAIRIVPKGSILSLFIEINNKYAVFSMLSHDQLAFG